MTLEHELALGYQRDLAPQELCIFGGDILNIRIEALLPSHLKAQPPDFPRYDIVPLVTETCAIWEGFP